MLIKQAAMKALTCIRKKNGGKPTAILIHRGRCCRITDLERVDRMIEDGANFVGRYDGRISLARLEADLRASLREVEANDE